ncbi:hypothetical protein [Halopseudomonas salegens]|uniref:Uncharacterized protein n=1 Tax=Halopseudomonas salegens TaxID=1434072 RepID=A0A1H2DYS6_9GAMM|nr:hypothetical protein [Halopseudomonas salegens]SDT88031.1 hypothetical protein SAMN05216210_0119 [Halopseudomonas salegens]
MKRSKVLHILLCLLLLGFSTLAAALSAVEHCVPQPLEHADCAGMAEQPNDAALLHISAELLCQLGGSCHVSAATLQNDVLADTPLPSPAPLVLPPADPFALAAPPFWRPPRH